MSDIEGVELSDMRALVGSMLGNAEQVQTLDGGSLRALSSVLVDRMMFARQAGITFNGNRDTYAVLGYSKVLTYKDYRDEYARGGIAKRIVDAYPDAVWRGGAEVYEDEDPTKDTTFESTWRELDARLGIWNRLQRAHKLSLLSTYAVLLIGAPGKLDEPLGKGSPDKLLYLQPYSAGGGPSINAQDNRNRAMNADCSIANFVTDPQDARFGLPEFYQLKRSPLSSQLLDTKVHWSRVIHVADGLLGDEVYAAPGLEAVWNYLNDLMKVVGGGSEAFWLRANAGLHLDVDKSMGMPSTVPGKAGVAGIDVDARTKLRDQAEELQHQLQRVMVTRGVTATQLSSATADFKNQADAIVTLIAGTKAIPKRILVGSEMGQLASGQDKDNWNTQVQDKRTSWAFPAVVKQLIDRLIEFGYLPKPKEYHVDWPVIEDLTQDEKVKLQKDMADVNKTQEAVVYTEDEIREVTCREPLTAEEESDGLSESQKAEIATKLAMTNKEMGITVFTDDEIRMISYKMEPLSDAQKVPIGAPEKISVGAPPGLGDASPQLLAATLHALEQAIEDDDLEAIGEILALAAPPQTFTIEKGLTRAEAFAEAKRLTKSDFRGVKYDASTGILKVLSNPEGINQYGTGSGKRSGGEPTHGQSSALGDKAEKLQKAAEKSGKKEDYAKAAAAHQAAADSHKAGYRSTLADIHGNLAAKMRAKAA